MSGRARACACVRVNVIERVCPWACVFVRMWVPACACARERVFRACVSACVCVCVCMRAYARLCGYVYVYRMYYNNLY